MADTGRVVAMSLDAKDGDYTSSTSKIGNRYNNDGKNNNHNAIILAVVVGDGIWLQKNQKKQVSALG